MHTSEPHYQHGSDYNLHYLTLTESFCVLSVDICVCVVVCVFVNHSWVPWCRDCFHRVRRWWHHILYNKTCHACPALQSRKVVFICYLNCLGFFLPNYTFSMVAHTSNLWGIQWLTHLKFGWYHRKHCVSPIGIQQRPTLSASGWLMFIAFVGLVGLG